MESRKLIEGGKSKHSKEHDDSDDSDQVDIRNKYMVPTKSH
jgi:hypothetical protein